MPHTDQEKAAAIVRYKQGVSVKELSAEYGVSERTICRWAKIHQAVNPDGREPLTAKEYNMLMRRITKLENIISILKRYIAPPMHR